jgi:hypothetical protein
VEAAEALAGTEGAVWGELSQDAQLSYYAQARLNEQ